VSTHRIKGFLHFLPSPLALSFSRSSSSQTVRDQFFEPHQANSRFPSDFISNHNTKVSIAIMSDNEEIEVEAVSGYQVLPKEVTEEIGSIKLFNKWSYEDVEIRDISLT
jgi:hypothetical protein